jgi:hypothetical protein
MDPVSAYEAPPPTVAETTKIEKPVAETSGFENLQPGDVVVGTDNPFVSPIGATESTEIVDIPDTPLAAPGGQPVAVVDAAPGSDAAGKTTGSWTWFIWLVGAGLALILGLLLFGQKFRQKFGSVAMGAAAGHSPSRRRTDANSRAAEALPDVDFQVSDTPPHSSSMTLDADFGDGSGLQDVSDMDVAQDFGFSASSTVDEELDMVLPEGADLEDDSGPTDIIGPSEREEDPLVVESEVMADVEDHGDYDLSMIVDVTKQDVVESDATEKDLQAVQVETTGDIESGDYTLSQEVDYKILEQDYEDEFTQTQALNAEIEKAAAELAERMDIDATGEVTAQLPENTRAVNDDISDSGVSEEMTAELLSADNDETAEMPVGDNDVTVDMEVESGIVDTKKKKKAS